MLKGCLIAVGGLLLLAVLLFVFVFAATGKAVDATETFLELIAEGKTTEAYRSTATAFQATTSEEEFKSVVKRVGLEGYESASWNNRSIQNEAAELTGTVKTKGGTSIPLTVTLVNEGGSWRVVGFKSGGGSGAKLEVPPTADLEELARSSLTLLQNAVQARDFTVFHGGISRRWQAQTTAAKIQAQFQSFVDKQVDLSVGTVKPVFSKPPALNESGLLVLEGYFPAQPREITFTLKYLYEHPAWKLAGIHVGTK